MVILHIAKISNNKANGVNVVVPQYINLQAKNNKVYFYNLNTKKISGLEKYQVFFDEFSSFYDSLNKQNIKIDLVIFNEVNNIEYIKIYKKIIKYKIPYIIIPHGELVAQALKKKWLKKKIAYTLWFNKFINKAIAIQCLSENEMNAIRIKTPYKFIATNGVIMPKDCKKEFSSNGLIISYIGRLEIKVKGLDLLVKAVQSIKEFCLQNKIMINIYGPDYNGRLEELNFLIQEAGVSDIIQYHTPVFGKEKTSVYLKSDLFIQTSRHEGMPLGVLEALSYGLPCILTTGTNLAEYLDEYKAGYNAGSSIEGIANAIVMAYNNKSALQQMSINAKNIVVDNFDFDKITDNTINQYQELVDEYSKKSNDN